MIMVHFMVFKSVLNQKLFQLCAVRSPNKAHSWAPTKLHTGDIVRDNR